MATARLSLSDLRLGLKDLFESKEKHKLLLSTRAGALYEPMLKDKRQQIEALPPALTEAGRPLADELTAKDEEHDAWGSAIFFHTEGYLHVPGLDAKVRKAIDTVRSAVIASRGTLRKSYPEEAAAAVARQKKLPALKADLAKLPVAGGTLYDWVVKFTNAGLDLHTLLAGRGKTTAETQGTAEDRGQSIVLRTETSGLLTRAREALADEAKANKSLPRNLDAQIFSYFDELLRARESQARPRPSKKTKGTPKAPPTGTGTGTGAAS